MIKSVLGILLAICGILLTFAYLKSICQYFRKVRIIRKWKISHENHSINLVEEYKQAPGPLPWPLLGNLDLLGRYATPYQAFTDIAKRFGDIYTLTLGSTRCLIVNNLDLMREVLNKNGKYFGGRPDFIRFHVLFGGNRSNSLALCDWSRLQQKRRNLARRYCSPRDMSSLFQKMSNIGCFEMKRLMNELQKILIISNDISIKQLLNQACANMFSNYMCSVCFDYDDKEFQTIVHYFDEIFWEINQGYIIDFLPWLSPFYADHLKKIVNWSTTIRKFIVERIICAREQVIDIDEPEKDFTDALLNSLAEDNEVSRDTIIFMLEDFIGGHSAVGNLVMLALAYIIQYPETGKKIQEEVDNVLQDTLDNITLMDIDRLPYTVATIYEVLRYCSSPIVPHVATEDVIVAGYGVTKGTMVFVNNYELNTNPKYWKKPEDFNPSRFFENMSADNKIKKLKKNIPHFLPFSIGKRTCIGQNLVKGFAFLLLANLLHKFDITTNDIKSIKTKPACLALTTDPFSVVLKPRKPSFKALGRTE